jgi:membrane-bound lytic murein transglycosylase F
MRPLVPAAAVAVSGLLAAPASADLAQVKASGVIRVIAVREEAPEMFNFGSGEPGFEREIVEGFAHLQGLKLQPVPANTSDDRIPMLNKGDGDMIIGIIATEPRRKLVDFTSEVLPARHIAVTHAPHAAIKTIEEFKTEKIGVVKGTSWAQAAVDAGVPLASMQQFNDRYEALDALKDGKITATVMSLSDFTLCLRKYPGLQGGVTLGASNIAAFAIRKDEPDLKAALDEYLGNLRKGPSWSRLVVKYFGESALSVLGRK